MLSALFGLITILLGLYGMWRWHAELLAFLKGIGPMSLVFAGIVALVAGLSRISPVKAPPSSKKEP
jgi:hypothetical protein